MTSRGSQASFGRGTMDSSRLQMKHSVRHSSVPFNKTIYGRTREAQDPSKTFFKASVEFLQVQSATMRNSLYD